MSIFGRFEKKVESAVNGVFARAFKGDVQPVEIAARLQKELDAEAKLMSRNKRLVPNEFMVGLSEHDHDKLYPYARTLTSEIAAELIVSEAVGNAIRHTGGPVWVSLAWSTERPVLRVYDIGAGFDPSSTAAEGDDDTDELMADSGRGLMIIQALAPKVSASMRANAGVVVSVTLPVVRRTTTTLQVSLTYDMVVGDFDGDGRQDLLWSAATLAGSHRWMGQPDGSLASVPAG